MPFVLHVRAGDDDILDRLVALGALDVECASGGLNALMPDGIDLEHVASALGTRQFSATPAVGRDEGSVWTLRPRPARIGRVDVPLIDATVFGTGQHPTTALCLEWLSEIVTMDPPSALLDVGTGTGILAIAALKLGVPRAVAIDIDEEAIRTAAENARLNGVADRLQLVLDGPGGVPGTFPLVVANVLAAALVDMAPPLVRRVAHHGRVVLSGIPRSLDTEVARAYRRLGMHHLRTTAREHWTALLLQASW